MQQTQSVFWIPIIPDFRVFHHHQYQQNHQHHRRRRRHIHFISIVLIFTASIISLYIITTTVAVTGFQPGKTNAEAKNYFCAYNIRKAYFASNRGYNYFLIACVTKHLNLWQCWSGLWSLCWFRFPFHNVIGQSKIGMVAEEFQDEFWL